MITKSAATLLYTTLLACALYGNAWADDYDVEFNGKSFSVTGSENFTGKMRISGTINATATPPVGNITITITEGKQNAVFAEVKSNKIIRAVLIESSGFVALDVVADYKIPKTGERGESVLYMRLPYAGNPPKSLSTGTDRSTMSMRTSTGQLTFNANVQGIRIGTVSKRPPSRR